MSDVDKTVNIDGTEIKESEMNSKQKYLTAQCKDLLGKKGRLEFELDQVQASLNIFQQALSESIKIQTDKIEEEKK